jgi:diketogulonate reductase-like aldo/keto reductase
MIKRKIPSTGEELTAEPKWSNYFFYATKVWTTGKQEGIHQMESSFQKMKRSPMDLMQIHNLTDWKKWQFSLRISNDTILSVIAPLIMYKNIKY